MPEEAVTQVQRVLALKTFDVFRSLAPQELAALAEHAKPRQFSAGAILQRAGVPARTLHFILQGDVELVQKESVMARLGPQDVVGGLSALIGDEQTNFARAVVETTTLQLHREDLLDVFEDNFSVLLGVLRTLAGAQLSARRKLGPHAGFSAAQSGAPPSSSGAITELGLVEKLFHLRGALDFAETRVEALADLAQDAKVVRRAAGEVLWNVGDLSEHNALLLEGVIAGSNEDPAQYFEFGPGALVGGIDSLAAEPRWYRAIAKEPITALYIRTQHLLDVIEDDVEFAMDMLRVFARTLRTLQAELPEVPESQPLV
ncbi:MAG TPA: cyclic nucleotide-binding domain-containing protein [Polyangiaceae bacterium]|nr:cyclic nucleotide-binding domain-containing protein [Polyangiaceae bacterium]